MSTLLKCAITFITMALVFYTVGVFAEKKHGKLLPWHVVVFWLGLICDTTGTTLMSKIAGDSFKFSLHGITGLLAIILMIFHAVWATIIIFKKDEHSKEVFHKFSIVVWAIWLIPYIIGMVIGMSV